MTAPIWVSDDGRVTLLQGDCRTVMAQMEPESVSCVVTSPPFWGLRKYDCPPSIWGGDPECRHRLDVEQLEGEGYTGRSRWQHSDHPGRTDEGISRATRPEAWTKTVAETATCSLCGAWRGWYGLEPTVAMYVEHTVEVLRAIRRVLRKDGVVWWDLDDSRGSSASGHAGRSKLEGGQPHGDGRRAAVKGQEKSLCLIPQRVAVAAQEDGWIVRSEIIIPTWMPESARDRPTDACRKVLMLVKQKSYWYDAAAVRVQGKPESLECYQYDFGGTKNEGLVESGDVRTRPVGDRSYLNGQRNLGSVWELPPSSYPAAHFATFPVEEPERCIKASCPAEICPKCGKARVRIVKATGPTTTEINKNHPALSGRAYEDGVGQNLDYRGPHTQTAQSAETVGWTSCDCGAGYEAGLVLDPFIGTGTTAVAAVKLGRRCIGIDLSESYLEQARTRLTVGDKGVRQMVAVQRAGARQEPLL